ncbi:MAG TPA: GntR family transcriptional regulator [Solirubrobacteraceae bacterium]|nr:GntR family transcriptional regulator [Solirubrobacteraceae bacterium]
MKRPRRALRHDVRDGLVRSILDGEFGPGDRLIEMHIAREYGTSQGPVREALRELEMLGFVRSEPHRGTYVRDPWQRGMLELYEVRAALEEFAARMATPKLCHDVSALQAEVDGMAAAADRNDVHAAVEHSEQFHRLIVEASDNRLLYNVWDSLSITDHTELTMVTLSLDIRTVAESHQPIVDAIAAGDVELACRVSREHQAWFVDMLNNMAEPEAASVEAAPAEPEPLPYG